MSTEPAMVSLPQPKRRARSSLIQALAGLAISALSLWLLLRQIDLSEVRVALSGGRTWLLAPAVATYFLSLTVRAWRWSVLVSAVQPMGVRRIWPVTAIGYMGNVLLPARLGELLRAAVLRRRGIHPGAALGTIATERVLDGLATVGILVLLLPVLDLDVPGWLAAAMRLAAALFVAALVGLAAMLLARPLVTGTSARVTARFPLAVRPAGWLERFLDGLAALRSPAILARAVALTLLGWTVSVCEYWLVLLAFAPLAHPLMAAFGVSAVGLSTAVPAAPGYIGTQDLAGVTVLGLLGLPRALAFSVTIIFHLVEIVPITLVGLFLMWREGLWSRKPASRNR